MATVRRWSGHEARALRAALRMTIRAFAEHLGVAARTVSKWEQFGAAITLLPDSQAILDTALGRAEDEAKLRFELLLSDGGLAGPAGTVDDVRRRILLGLLGPAAVSPLSAKLEELRRGLDGVLDADLTDRDVDDWEQTVSDYARDVGTIPTEQLLSHLVADFAEIQARIADASGVMRRPLIHSASQLAALIAIAFVNVGEGHSAQRWWRTAARATAEVSDPSLAALVRGRQAVFSVGSARAERVLGLAEAAVNLGNSKPCVGVISGMAARAQILAQMGRHDEAEHALHIVTDMYGRLPTAATEDTGSQWNWSEQRLHHVRSHVHTYAGRVAQAASAQDSALAVYPIANFQGRTQIEIHRSIALIRFGDVNVGTRHLTTTMEQLLPWQRRDGIIRRTAFSALEIVPAEERHLPGFQQARELVTSAEQAGQ